MTKAAWILLGAGLTLVLVGSLAGLRLWVAIGSALLLFLPLVRLVLGRFPRAVLHVQAPEGRIQRGDAARTELQVTWRNSALFRKRILLRAGDGALGMITCGRSGAVSRTQVPVDTSRRGLTSVGPFVLEYGDPWGVFTRTVERTEGRDVLIYPRIREADIRLLDRAQSGSTRRQVVGDEQFHALREYMLGDESRRIHWRSTARLGKLMVRESVGAASTGVAVILDVDPMAYVKREALDNRLDADAFERAVEMTAGIVHALVAQRQPMHLLLSDGSTVVTAMPGDLAEPAMRMLALAQLGSDLSGGFGALARQLARLKPSSVVVVSVWPNRALRQLARRWRHTMLSAAEPLAELVHA